MVTSNNEKIKEEGLGLLLQYLEVTLEESPDIMSLYANCINVAAFNEGTDNLELDYTPIICKTVLTEVLVAEWFTHTCYCIL